MAARTKAQLPVGSAQWIQDENRQIAQFCTQETEDFSFSARNEIEWLNEHMAEIFNKNQVNVTEIFKTPGKLRGKTPRTNRKRNALEVRQPLTDMFTTHTPLNTNLSYAGTPSRGGAKIHVALDPVISTASQKKENPHTDSGYHGTTEDEMDVDVARVALSLSTTQEKIDNPVPLDLSVDGEQGPTGQTDREKTIEGSFHSAREDIAMIVTHTEGSEAVKEMAEPVDVENPEFTVNNPRLSAATTAPAEVAPDDAMDVVEVDNESVLAENPSLDASHSSSAESSPAKTLLRKSSLTFAALPAREPLTTKKSIGARISGTAHFDQHRGTIGRGSFLGRYTGGKSLGGLRQPEPVRDENNEEMDVDKPDNTGLSQDEIDEDPKMLAEDNTSSTERLHEKMNILGSSTPVPTKTILPAPIATQQPIYPTLVTLDPPLSRIEQAAEKNLVANTTIINDEDDDWIQPPVPSNDSKRSNLNKLFSKTHNKDDASKHYNDGRIGNGNALEKLPPSGQTRSLDPPRERRELPMLPTGLRSRSPFEGGEKGQLKIAEPSIKPAAETEQPSKSSTTPHGTPASKRYVDGPLSASKSKLQSIMKTARGLFTSSAGISAQAKMETLSPHSMKTRGQARGPNVAEKSGTNLKPSPAKEKAYSKAPNGSEAQRDDEVVRSKNSEPAPEGRRTRSSTEKDKREKEKEAREQERMSPEFQRGGLAEGKRAPLEQRDQATPAMQRALHETKEVMSVIASHPTKPVRQSPRRAQNQQEVEKEIGQLQVQSIVNESVESSYSILPPSALVQPSSSFQKPKELRRPVKPAKEAPSKSKPQPVAIRVGTLSQRIPLNVAVPSGMQEPPPPPPKQPGPVKKASNASTTSNSLKSSVSSNVTKPKALLAAERKREQDEKELQRKLEQKRENERKRAAQQEELRRQDQAQQQEAERQRERERSAAAQDPKKLAQRQAIEKRRIENGKKEQQRQVSQQEKSQLLSTNRQELGGARPPSRLHGIHEYGRPSNQPPAGAVRPAVKRVFEPEMDGENMGPVRGQGGSLYQQMDAKRRRTEEEDFLEVVVRPTMLPPKRQSNARKDGPKQSIFGNGYITSQAPSHNYHQSSSLLKTSTLNQTYQTHQHANQASRAGLPHEMAKYTNGKIPFAEAPNPPPKSPLRARPAAPPPAKSSPQYMNGENIDLAEIPTDSEDEESDDEKGKGALLPDWVQSPQLREQLMIQERYVDADAVFGPARSPHMEEMFKGREHRFRSRTSSANWAGPDRLTEEEIRNDRAGREKLRRQGGWTFEL